MSNWDFGRPTAGRGDADDPGDLGSPGDAGDADDPGDAHGDWSSPLPYGPGEVHYRGAAGPGWAGGEWAGGPAPRGAAPDGGTRANGGPWLDGFDEGPSNARANLSADAEAGQQTRIWPDGPLTQQRWSPVRDQQTIVDLLGMSTPDGTGRAGRRGGVRRWLIPAGIALVAAAVGAATVLLTGGHAATTSAAGRAPASPGGAAGPAGTGVPARGTPTASAAPHGTAPAGTGQAGTGQAGTGQAGTAPAGTGALTVAQARGVLAGYTTLNNEANAQRSDSLLGTIETGSSYAIDAGQYLMQAAEGAAAYPAFGPVQATYYVPRGEPAGGPRWFVVQVSNALSSDPHKVTSTEYLLFTQSAPGGSWQDAVEPFALSGASAPQIALGADGLATAVSPTTTSVTVPPGQLARVTAASLDGTGPVASPGDLADQSDQAFWQRTLPAASVTDGHAAAAGPDGQEFALLTTDGGALVFYTDIATLTITAPAGSALHLTVPGYYSPAQPLSSASLTYLEQFAAYDPPTGAHAGGPRIVADYSGITGR